MSANRQSLTAALGIKDPADAQTQKIHCPHPDHPDENPSLSVFYDTDKKATRLVCYSQKCDLTEVLKAEGVKSTYWQDSGANVVKDATSIPKVKEAEYAYEDEEGNVLYVVERYRQSDGGKTFRQRKPDGSRSLKGVRRVLYHLPEVLAAVKLGATIYVVEGEKDADRLIREGFMSTTCAQGAGKWQESFSEALEGAHVVVIADKDTPGYKHARQVQASLQPLAASVRVLQAKSGKDVSDHLDSGHGIADLEECPLEIAPHDYDPNSFFAQGTGLKALALKEAVLEFGAIVPDETGLLWSYTDGVYRPDGDKVVRRRVASLLKDRYRREHAGTVLDMLANQEPLWNDDTIDSNFINVPNGLIDWKTGTLKPHSPHVPSIARVPIEWDPDATCPEIDAWLKQIFPAGDCNEFIYEIAGYALFNKQPLHKAIMLSGVGRNGKGTLLRLLKQLIGIENISAVTPQALDDNRFASSRLYGKLANLCGDVNAKTFRATETFKQATGEDYLAAERKGQDGFEFTVRALLVAAFNELPRTADTTEGYFSRWIVVPFVRRFSEKEADRTLDGRLQAPEEMQGFLVQAVKGLRRLMERGNFDPPASVLEATQNFRRSTDPVQSFLWDTVIPQEGSRVDRAELYGKYKAWAEDNANGFKLNKAKFFEKVVSSGSQLFDTTIEDARKYAGKFVYHGLAWKTEEAKAEEPQEKPEKGLGQNLGQNSEFGAKTGVVLNSLGNERFVENMKQGSVLPQAPEKCPKNAPEPISVFAAWADKGDDAPWRKGVG